MKRIGGDTLVFKERPDLLARPPGERIEFHQHFSLSLKGPVLLTPASSPRVAGFPICSLPPSSMQDG